MKNQDIHIKALQQGLETRRQRTIGIFATMALILMTITVAFSISLSQTTTKSDLEKVQSEIEDIKDKVKADFEKTDSKIEELENQIEAIETVQANETEVDQQIGYRYLKRLPTKIAMCPGRVSGLRCLER